MKVRTRRKYGYSLVELLVALGVLVTVVAISFPVLRGLRRRSKSAGCSSNLRQLGVGLNLYLVDHALRMPVMAAAVPEKKEGEATMDTVLPEYLDEEEMVFKCPGDKQGLYERTGTSYYWNSLLNGQHSNQLKFFNLDGDYRVPIFADKEGFHYGIGDAVQVLYADGRVEKDFKFWVEEAK